MTIRDRVREIYPRAIDSQCEGGVDGCPSDFPELEHYCPHGGEGCSADDDCEACWSQEYREEPKPKKFSLPLPMLLLLGAALEIIFAVVFMVQGDSGQVQNCLIMNLFYLIAAGVWRDRG